MPDPIPTPADPTPPEPNPQPTPPAPQPAPQPAPAPVAPPAQPTPPVQYRGNPDEYVHELREEAKSHRLAAEKAATDLSTVTGERDTATARTTQLERENFILRNASKHGINPDVALDSNSFMTAFADIDLADEAKVTEAFKTALEKNSTLQAGPKLPGTSGGGHQGGQPTSTPLTLDSAVKAALSS